ncbi:unnamed protein product [Chrysoparadoxa australica]
MDLAASLGCDHGALVGALSSLNGDLYTVSELKQAQLWEITKEAAEIIAVGSPEVLVLNAVPEGDAGITKAELESKLGASVAKIGMGGCMKQKWLKKGEGGALVRAVGEVEDTTQAQLAAIQAANGCVRTSMPHHYSSFFISLLHLVRPIRAPDSVSEAVGKELKRRKLIKQVILKYFRVTRGPNFSPQRKKKHADLTKEMLDSGEWQSSTFKPYNFNTLGVPVGGGYLHPLLKVRAEFRKTLMGMGFEEMPTNRWVESSFWNFDSLFQPQSHPARDAHDTFFIKEPGSCLSLPEDYLQVVKRTHEDGGDSGSQGYGCKWKREEAVKNLLRTHTTAVSSQMLYKLANQEGGFQPKKYFSIDRVFRNESMDATHLCEFHQVEGMVADRNLCLGDLIGTIKTFFEQIGITQVRFKPAYNPYTEPSMEIFGYHPDLKCWTEIGNSGMFRPEMLQPMGLPDDVRVIAWGLSLERPTMIKYRISNIRELFGHKADLGMAKKAPMCRFDTVFLNWRFKLQKEDVSLISQLNPQARRSSAGSTCSMAKDVSDWRRERN